MYDTIKGVLKILDSSLGEHAGKNYVSFLDTKKEKRVVAQILALVAIAEELKRANQLKEMELRRKYGDDFV